MITELIHDDKRLRYATRLKDGRAIKHYAEKIHAALRASATGLTREEIGAVLGAGVAASRIGAALALLRQDRLARFVLEGGYSERWFWAGEP